MRDVEESALRVDFVSSSRFSAGAHVLLELFAGNPRQDWHFRMLI